MCIDVQQTPSMHWLHPALENCLLRESTIIEYKVLLYGWKFRKKNSSSSSTNRAATVWTTMVLKLWGHEIQIEHEQTYFRHVQKDTQQIKGAKDCKRHEQTIKRCTVVERWWKQSTHCNPKKLQQRPSKHKHSAIMKPPTYSTAHIRV